MQTAKIMSWQDGDHWLGYRQEFPDYWTQGETLDDLREHLRDLNLDQATGVIPGVRRVDDLVIA